MTGAIRTAGAASLIWVTLGLADPNGAAAAPRLHYPPDRLLVSGDGLLHVVGELRNAGASAQMRVSAQGAAHAPPLARPGGGVVFHARVRLRPGLNTLTIVFAPVRQGPVTVTRRVFYRSPLGEESPAGFVSQPFHRIGTRAACAGCHDLTARPTDAAPPVPEQSSCFGCHAQVTKAAEVHGPAAVWACTRCHDTGSAGLPYGTPDPVMPLCVSCHTDVKARLDGSPYRHGPAASGRCTLCHSPHGSDQPFFLKQAPGTLCTACHSDEAAGRHGISRAPTAQGHPTEGRLDPKRPGRELSCTSCHEPHAAPSPRLWTFKAVLWHDLCRQCHPAIYGD